MKKVLIIVTFFIMSLTFANTTVFALPGCTVGPQFCFDDGSGGGGGGTGGIPDNYIVDTGLIAEVVTYYGYHVDFYLIYVEAADGAVDLNTSDIYFRHYYYGSQGDPIGYGSFYDSDHIVQRDPDSSLLADGGGYWLQYGYDQQDFESNSYVSGLYVSSSITPLLGVNSGGDIFFDGDTSGNNNWHLNNAYYNISTEEFFISEYDGMSGNLGRFLNGEMGYSSHVDSHILGWALVGIEYWQYVEAYTTYDNIYQLDTGTTDEVIGDFVLINR